MTRVPPSQQIREALAELLAEGQASEVDVASALIRLGLSAWSKNCWSRK